MPAETLSRSRTESTITAALRSHSCQFFFTHLYSSID